MCCSFGSKGQSILGAWEQEYTSKNGDQLKSVVIFADGYQAIATYNTQTGKFMGSNGGTWKLEGDMMTEKVEFDTHNADRVGSEVTFKVAIQDSIIAIVGSEMTLRRIDNGLPGKLQGAWLMSGREKDAAVHLRDTSAPRKTMKILSGTRFQWIAYNTETKQFMGTGGGSYTTADGVYTEHIAFFSKDETKVGTILSFNYKLLDGKWQHSGSSSKGDSINEIWSIRK